MQPKIKQFGSVLEAALIYAQRGWHVLPLDGKIPILKDWPHTATTDPDIIHNWFAGEYVEANVGIATGIKSGVFILDVDGETGEAALLDLEHTYGKLPETYEVKTGGGRHLYFIQPAGVHTKTQASGEIGLRLDIRGDGGQVVAPPSVHPDTHKRYDVLRDVIPAHAPEWLIERITRHKPGELKTPHEIPDVIKEHQRDVTLTSIAGRLRRLGLTAEEMLGALVEINKQRCRPPLKDSQVLEKVKSVARYPPGRVMVDGTLNSAELIEISGDTEKDEPITWRWPLYLPCGMVTAWGGDPGQGKSTMAYTLAARITRGAAMFDDDDRYAPADVVILTAEDDRKKIAQPRLRLANADMKRVHFISVLTAQGDVVSFPKHLVQLTEKIREHKATFAMIDPIDSFLSEDVDSHKNAEVRRAVMPIVQIAENTGTSILVLGHLNKSSTTSAIYRFGGSIAFIAAPRACFVFTQDDDGADNHHVMTCVKTNVGRKPKGLRFEIVVEHVREVGEVTKINFLGNTEASVDDLLGQNNNGGGNTKRRQASEYFKQLLADGPIRSVEAEKHVKKQVQCSAGTCRNARLEVTSWREIKNEFWIALKDFRWDTFTPPTAAREPGED